MVASPTTGREAADPAPGTTLPGIRPPASLQLVGYRVVTRLARPLAGLVLGARARRGKEETSRRGERLGRASLPRPAGPLAWVHAASVGEASSVMPLLAVLAERRPHTAILVTTGTVTSARFVASRLPPGTMHQYVPLDSPAFVGRFLDYWRPSVAVLTEQEVWPNLVVETHGRGIPIALVNGRMSERSFERWQRSPRMAEALFGRLAVVLTQNETLARRFAALGARRTVDAGNLKIDAPPPPIDAAALRALEAALGGRPRIVAASTHDGEEMVVAGAHHALAGRFPGLCTIMAPRHPDRGSGLAGALAAQGFRVARRSQGELPAPGVDVYVADTIGELGTFYASTPVAFVGGSLVPRGGQNPIEAVRHGAAVLTGPSWYNFEDCYRALIDAGGAGEVRSSAEIAARASALLGDPAELAGVRARATRAIDELSGALERTITALLPLLPAEPAEPALA